MGVGQKKEQRRLVLVVFNAVVACFTMAGCKGSWVYNKADFVEHKIPGGMQDAEDCEVCHKMPYRTWKESSHGDKKRWRVPGSPGNTSSAVRAT